MVSYNSLKSNFCYNFNEKRKTKHKLRLMHSHKNSKINFRYHFKLKHLLKRKPYLFKVCNFLINIFLFALISDENSKGFTHQYLGVFVVNLNPSSISVFFYFFLYMKGILSFRTLCLWTLYI